MCWWAKTVMLKEDFKDCNKSLDMLYKRLTEEFLTLQHNEYSFTDHWQSSEISWNKSNEVLQL